MIKNERIAIVIPSYNEEKTLKNLFYKMDGVYKILKDGYQIKFILIDDGSSDNSRRLMEDKYKNAPFVDLIYHEKNQGYGASLRTGFKRALDEGYSYIVTIDADTNYDQFMIPYFIYDFNPNKEDILVASPWHPECSRINFPWVRFVFSYVMSRLYQFSLSPECPPMTCYSSCFRLYKSEVLKDIKHKSNDFLTNSEIICRGLLKGYRAREIPINVNYRLFGVSKMRVMHNIFKHFAFMYYLMRNKKKIISEMRQNNLLKAKESDLEDSVSCWNAA